MTREAARERVLATLRFLRNAPQGPARTRHGRLQGLLLPLPRHEDRRALRGQRAVHGRHGAPRSPACCSASRTSTARDPEEAEIRRLADQIYRRVDWRWAQPHAPAISHGWSPEDGFLEYDWRGYNEAMLVYLLALGSPTHPVGRRRVARVDEHLRQELGQRVRPGVPRRSRRCSATSTRTSGSISAGMQDAYMRRRGIDYFENTRRADLRAAGVRDRQPARAARTTARPSGASPRATVRPTSSSTIDGVTRRFRDLRRARHRRRPRAYDDCTLAPTAAGRVDSVRAGARDPRGARACTSATASTSTRTYGFLDAFNPSFTFDDRAAPRPLHPGLRLGRQRLPRHRPGRDRRDDRELPQRARSGRRCAEIPYVRRGLAARRLHRRLARRVALTADARGARLRRRVRRWRRSPLASRLRSRGRRRHASASGRWAAKARSSRQLAARVRARASGHPRRGPAAAVDRGAREAADRVRRRRRRPTSASSATPGYRSSSRSARSSRSTRTSRRRAIVTRDDYFAGIWDTNVVDGRLYGMPWYVDTRLLFYRTRPARRGGHRRAAARLGRVDARAGGDQGAGAGTAATRSCCR